MWTNSKISLRNTKISPVFRLVGTRYLINIVLSALVWRVNFLLAKNLLKSLLFISNYNFEADKAFSKWANTLPALHSLSSQFLAENKLMMKASLWHWRLNIYESEGPRRKYLLLSERFTSREARGAPGDAWPHLESRRSGAGSAVCFASPRGARLHLNPLRWRFSNPGSAAGLLVIIIIFRRVWFPITRPFYLRKIPASILKTTCKLCPFLIS